MRARVSHDKGDQARILEIRKISLRRLREGGVARLAAMARNHHRAIWGAIILRPFVIKMLRVFVFS